MMKATFWILGSLSTALLASTALAMGGDRCGAQATTASVVADGTKDTAKKEEPKKMETAKGGLIDPKATAEIGKPAPDFKLTTLDGKEVQLSSFKGKTVVLEWFNPTCPFCVYGYAEEGPLAKQSERLAADGVVWLAINSGYEKDPGADRTKNKEFVEKHKLKQPVLFDTTGAVGMAYAAKSTPHMFVIDPKGVLVYRGALDNAPQGQLEKDKTMVNYVDAALADIKAGKPVQTAETKSYGCNVKYAPKP
jgi:peroxiredoxin